MRTPLYINSIGSKHLWNYLFCVVLVFLSFISFGLCELSNHERIRVTDEMMFGTKNINTVLNGMSRGIGISKEAGHSDMAEFESLLLEYMNDVLNRNQFEIIPGVSIKKDNKTVDSSYSDILASRSFDESVLASFKRFAETHTFDVDLPRLDQTGRLFFFKGLKKFMWPLMIGLQMVKTVLLVLFLPSIIGSVGKIVGKGLPTLSGFAHPAETVDDLEFKDNSFNGDQLDKQAPYNGYQYNSQDSSNSNNFASQMYDSAQTNNALSRFGLGGSKVAYVNTAASKYRNNNAFSAKKDEFKVFHDIPNSSLLLTNYDPFYSPLLSRLDAVFQQFSLGLPSDEKCREKLVCRFYSSPAKYAPYSNLVSAQLSRELNELKKPSSDNPDILRFFKYMRAAKDGQDGVDCDVVNVECSTLSDMTNPAMINTFNDINKLVQARKI